MNEKTKFNLFKANKKFDEERGKNSIECCKLLIQYFEKYPQIRFKQALNIFESIYYNNNNGFYEEPEETLTKLKKFVEQ